MKYFSLICASLSAFRHFVSADFRKHGRKISQACNAYVNSVKAGIFDGEGNEPILSISKLSDSLWAVWHHFYFYFVINFFF